MTAAATWAPDHDNYVLLTQWMSDRGYPAWAVARAVATPCYYQDEFAMAVAVRDHEALGHTVYLNNDYDAYCNDGETCGWTFTAPTYADASR